MNGRILVTSPQVNTDNDGRTTTWIPQGGEDSLTTVLDEQERESGSRLTTGMKGMRVLVGP